MARQDWKKKLYIIWENIKSFAKNSWMWFKEKCAYLKTNFEKSEAASCNKEMPKIFNPKYFEPRTKPPSFVLSVIFTTIKVLVISLVVIACIGMGVLLGIASSYTTTAPNLNVAVVGGADRSSVIYDCYGNRVASYASIENRIWASYDEIPQTMIDAIVSIEDTRFFMHNGVDTKRLFGAIVNNITGNSTHGGSTITQQLIKLTVLTSEQTFKRKIQEAFLALELETKYSKEQILEAYLNTISLGGSNYGIKTAAMDYFGKELHELTIKECAILAGLAQNPSYYNPRLNYYVRDNYEATDSIIEVMLALNLSLISMKQRCLNAWYSPADKQCEQFSVKNEEDNMLLFDIISRLPRQTDTFLPETVARSCMEASVDISAVYFVTSQLRRDFIGKMTDIELFRNKRVKILLVSGAIETDEQAELANAVALTQGFELWKIDKDNIVQSLNAAIELHKKQ